ncbi:hypothetical protein [Croceicoccus bisphenolivorans]|nr:hypothetical protein [Croceicoccus bisphenolivorans]
MHLPQWFREHQPDYNLRWILVIAGMAILLVAFVLMGVMDTV